MKTGLPPSLWPLVHLLATGESWPPSGPEAAGQLVRQAEREGLLPLLFEAEGLPESIAAALEGHRALQRLYTRRSEILEQAGAALAPLLEDEAVILLKGADYRRRLYHRPELRPMQDIDLLLSRDRIDAVVRRLLQGGLVLHVPVGSAARLPSYHERVLSLGEVIVEIHHSFVQRARHRIDYDAVWARRVPVGWGPGVATRLENADGLAYHALSLAVDEFSVPLIRYVDLWLLLESEPETLPAAAARARAWQAVRPLYGALRQMFRLFPESRSAVREAVARDLCAPSTRLFLDSRVLPAVEDHGKGKNMSRSVELWRKLWLLDNVWRRIRFGLYHLGALVAGFWLRWRAGANPWRRV